MSNIKYLRKFIMLDKLNSNTKIKGHTKIEVRDGRGKLEVNIDGITDVNKVYDIIFLTNAGFKEDIAYFGTISDVGGGKAFYKKDFNPKNVLHSDKSIDDYNIIVIKGVNSEILYGYIHKKENEKDIVSLLTKKQNKKEEVEAEEVEPKEEEIKVEEVQEVETKEEKIEVEEVEEIETKEEKIEVEEAEEIEVKEEVQVEEEEENIKGTENQEVEIEEDEDKEKEKEETIQVEQVEEEKEEKKNIEEEEDETVQVKEEKEEIIEEEFEYPNADSNLEDYILSKSEKDLEEYYRYKEYKSKENIDNYKRESATPENNSSYSLNILNYFNQVEPFKINLKEYSFWEITEDSVNIRRGFLPYYNYVVNMRYPYTLMHKMNSPSKQIRKYRHYLFGIVSENESTVKHFVYGIPGTFTRSEQPFRGMSGFTTWLESKDSGDKKLGYWLIHIDAKTGRIITPLRPTSPLK